MGDDLMERRSRGIGKQKDPRVCFASIHVELYRASYDVLLFELLIPLIYSWTLIDNDEGWFSHHAFELL
jgi:hypothetical protein